MTDQGERENTAAYARSPGPEKPPNSVGYVTGRSNSCWPPAALGVSPTKGQEGMEKRIKSYFGAVKEILQSHIQRTNSGCQTGWCSGRDG